MAQERFTPKELRTALSRKAHKFSAERCEVDGINFPSRKQARRYLELKLLLRAGKITDLEIDNVRTTFRLEVNGQLICKYRADAVYFEDGAIIVEDAKGFRTEVYELKRKLMRACLGIEIREV